MTPTWRWLVLGMLFTITGISFIDRQTLSVLAPVPRSALHLSYEKCGRRFSMQSAKIVHRWRSILVAFATIHRSGPGLSFGIFAVFFSLTLASVCFAQDVDGRAKKVAATEAPVISVSYSAALTNAAGEAPEAVSQPSPTADFASGFSARLQKSYHWWLGYQVTYGFNNIGIRRNLNDIAYSFIQSGMHELSASYLLKGPARYGFKSFAEAGAGALIFAPTYGTADLVSTYTEGWGGKTIAPKTVITRQDGLETQSRGTGIFGVGIDYDLNQHFGARAEYRALAYVTPTFKNGTAYGEQQYTLAQEPVAGMYFKF